jgi:hypothetical protein
MSTADMQVTPFTRRMVGFVATHPVVTLLVGLSLAAASIAGLPKLRADFTHRGFFWDDDPYLLQFDAFERRFGNDDAVVLGVHSPSGVFDVETATLLRTITEKMWQVPEVIRVDSLANYNWVHADGDDIVVEPLLPEVVTPEILAARKRVALAHEVVPDYLVSRDAKTALIFARIKPGLERAPQADVIIQAVREVVAEARRGDHVIHVTGGPAITYAFKEVAEHDLGRLFPTALVVAAIFLIVVLRSIAGLLIPLGVMLLTIVSSFGFAGWTGIVVNTVSTTIPSILLAACIADSVHILVSFFEELKRGHERRTAARRSLELNLLATFLTSLTTAVAFLSFASANLKPIAGLGFMAAFGAMLAWALTYLVLGSLLFLLPIRAGRVAPEVADRDRRWAGRYVDFLARHRRKVMGIAAAVTVTASVLAIRNEVNSDPFKYFQPEVPIRVANEFVEQAVGGARGMELVIDAGVEDGVKDPAFLTKVDALQTWIDAIPGVTRTLSIVDILKSVNRSLHGDRPEHYRLPDTRGAIAQELFLYTMSLPQGMDLNDRVTIKNDALRVTVLNTISTSRETMNAIDAIEAKARAMGLRAHCTGKFSLYQRTNGYVVRSFLVSFVTSVFSISVIMTAFLRSVRLGLLAMIPNVVPVLIGGGVLVAIGQPLDIGTVLVAAVCLGIAVDDTIHVLANFRRLRGQGLDPNGALKATLAHTGRPLLATTAILVLAFGSFLQADFTPNLYFGLLTAVILGVALLTDLTVTCAFLVRGEPDVEATPALKPAVGRPT